MLTWLGLVKGVWKGLGYAHGAVEKHESCCGGHKTACVIPETQCPPRCVEELGWVIRRGAVPHANVEVRNVGKIPRTFHFVATELAGPEPTTASLHVQPGSALLAPGQSVLVRVRLDDSRELRAGQTYRAELRVRGSWEQCVPLCCKVKPDPFDEAFVAYKGSHAFWPELDRGGKRITWNIDRGVMPEAAITVHNDQDSPQTFNFGVRALVGAGVGAGAEAAQITLATDSMLLGPNQRGVLRVTLQGSMALHQVQTYHGDVIVRAVGERRIPVLCEVEPDAFAHTTLEQGEAPTRVFAHQWYHHFQCTESCVPALNTFDA